MNAEEVDLAAALLRERDSIKRVFEGDSMIEYVMCVVKLDNSISRNVLTDAASFRSYLTARYQAIESELKALGVET